MAGFGCRPRASDGTLAVASFGIFEPPFGTGFDWHPNSCVVDGAGNLYVGLSDTMATGFGWGGLLKLGQAGNVLATFSPQPELMFDPSLGEFVLVGRGTDWVDLAADQRTLFYTSTVMTGIPASIKRFDVSTGTQLTDFCNPCDDGAGGVSTVGPFFDLRILPDGSVLVADWYESDVTGLVRRYKKVGEQVEQIQIYVAADAWGSFYPWALGLDPGGTSFWAADALTGEIFKFDLDSGLVLGQFVGGECGDSVGSCEVTGLAIVGEPRAAAATAKATPPVTGAGGRGLGGGGGGEG